ncbi:MAG: 50S ribosomal protein L19 [Candidatus Omnitrophica bacterium]|nr:50S ribosomal protein L19 [Candidatus Omnitrophota bacterium]
MEKELKNSLKKDYPEFKQGDVIKVFYKVREKDKIRLHPVEGVIIKIKGAMHRKSFTVRRTAYGQSYEVTFPYFSPNIQKIDLIKESRRRPRRSRLHYLRGRVGKKSVLT